MAKTQAKLTGKRSFCNTCGEYFSTTSNFDKHRVGAHGIDRRCVDPASVGLVISTRGPSTYWAMPGAVEDGLDDISIHDGEAI